MWDDSRRERCMWYISLWTLHKPLMSSYFSVQSCVVMHVDPCWAHWTAVKQAAGERWVKSYGETSITDGLTHLRREKERETEGEPGESRQQTLSYTAELWPCAELGESFLSSPAEPTPTRSVWIQSDQRQHRIWCKVWSRFWQQTYSSLFAPTLILKKTFMSNDVWE